MSIDRKRTRRLALTFVIIILISGGLGLSKPGSKLLNAITNCNGSPAIAEEAALGIEAIALKHAGVIMQSSPEWATQMGVSEALAGEGFKARLADFSSRANEDAYEALDSMINDLESIDRASLSRQEQLTYDVMAFSYAIAQRQNAFRTGHPSFLLASPPYAVNQLFGPQIDIPRLLIAQQRVRNTADAEDWLSRLSEIDRVLDEVAQLAETDSQRGVTPPYFALEAVANAAEAFIDKPVKEHMLYSSFAAKIDAIEDLGNQERETLLGFAETTLKDEVYPAYENFRQRMLALVPAAGRDAGVWRLPNGSAMYQVALESWGAGDLTADEIHQIGLDDVERLHSEMDRILRSVGYVEGSVGERMARLAQDPAYLIENTDEAKLELVNALQGDVDIVLEKAPEWFLDIPDYEVEVRRIPKHEQDSSAGGYYTPPPLDGSRPGIFWVNLKDAADVPTYTLKSLVFHEAVPGHHFQAGKSLSIRGLPLIQNLMWFGDYGEGWALYAEELAKEMGMYEGDPLGDLGRYRMELYRAARLVVDTGLHHKRWGREQAIDYMVEVTGESRSSITREIDRYAVWPGQAASYKLGMIQFQRLRSKAEAELGPRFNIREFHDVVLRDGPMPMATLALRVDEWIQSTGDAE